MPVSTILDRERFLQWIGGNLIVRATSGVPTGRKLGSGEVMLVWQNDADIPNANNAPLVVIDRSQMRDFFAFTSTYISTYSPFSAFFRVVSSDVIEGVIQTTINPHRQTLPEEFVAILVAEAYVQSGGTPLEKTSVQACLATISFSILSAIARGYDRETLNYIMPAWSAARGLLTTEKLTLDADDINAFWAPVLDAIYGEGHRSGSGYGSYTRVVQFLRRQLAEGAGHSDAGLELLEELRDPISDVGHKKALTREERVLAFSSTLASLANDKNVEPLVKEIIAGFMLARIGDGSLEYLQACQQFLPSMPRAALWYGFFVTCWRNNDVLTISECLGRRLSRHLFSWSGAFSSPVCDIGFNELHIRVQGPSRSVPYRTEHQAVTLIELLPGVTARFRTSRQNAVTSNYAHRIGERDALRQVRTSLQNAAKLLERVEVQLEQQDGLFDNLPDQRRTRTRNYK